MITDNLFGEFIFYKYMYNVYKSFASIEHLKMCKRSWNEM